MVKCVITGEVNHKKGFTYIWHFGAPKRPLVIHQTIHFLCTLVRIILFMFSFVYHQQQPATTTKHSHQQTHEQFTHYFVQVFGVPSCPCIFRYYFSQSYLLPVLFLQRHPNLIFYCNCKISSVAYDMFACRLCLIA